MSLITLTNAKEFLQISHDKEDIILQIVLDGMEEWVQKFCAIKFYSGNSLPDIEENVDGGNRNLRPLWHPILDVTEILDRDSSNAEVDTSLWRFSKYRIWYIDETYWGAGEARYQVTYNAGYVFDMLTPGLKLIMFQLIHRAYNKRGGVMSDSVSGFNEKWAELLKSDELTQLRGFAFKSNFS